MMTMKNVLIAIIAVICISYGTPITAQAVTEAQVRQELEKRGIDEEEVRKRLIARGYDPDNVDPNDPVALLRLKEAADQVVAEIQAEQVNATAATPVPTEETITPEVVAPQKDEIENATDQLATEEDMVQKPSDIYGQQLFRNNSIRFYKKSEYINVPLDYVLGPGDQVTVSIWGAQEANLSEQITSGGYVKFPLVPRISLTGLTLEKAKSLVKSKLSRFYNGFRSSQFEMTVVATRNINIYISGEVENVGSYNISAVNTAVNALAAAGGPSSIGSVRNIKVISEQTGNKTLDLYTFMSDPSSSRDYYLSDGDFIVVPVVGTVVKIVGAIHRPLQYELLPSETLGDLISYAGGLKVDALRQNVKITRYENDQRIIINVDLSQSDSNNFRLQDGDVVEIISIDEEIENAVAVLGALNNPGEFAIKNGDRLSDLLQKVVLSKDAILDIAYLTRLNDDQKTVRWQVVDLQAAKSNPGSTADIVLAKGDKITIRGKAGFVTANTFTIKGAVNEEGEYQLDSEQDLRVSDAIFLGQGLTEGATDFGYIIRNRPGSVRPQYIAIDIEAILSDPASTANVAIEPGDVLQLYNKSQYLDEAYITVDGAVRNPSQYKYDESLTLKDVLLLSQGLSLEASYGKVDIFRLEFDKSNKTQTLVATVSVDQDLNPTSGDVVLQPFDQIIVRQAPEFSEQQPVFISGEVKYPGKYYLLKDNYTMVDLINEAGGLTDEAFVGGALLQRSSDDTGFIVVDLDEAIKKPSQPGNVILQVEDRLHIPKTNNLVTVRGAVNKTNAFNTDVAVATNINFVYESGHSAKHYIERSGGFHPKADKESVSVRLANGELKRTKRFLFWRLYPNVPPGSTVSVEYKAAEELREKEEREPIDWSRVLSSSIAQATTILSLILLIQNVD